MMMEFTTPPSYGASVVNVGGVATDDGLLFAGATGTITHTATGEDPDWPEPTAAAFAWRGRTPAGASATATIDGSLTPRLDKVDVLAEVPGFVKAIVGGVVG